MYIYTFDPSKCVFCHCDALQAMRHMKYNFVGLDEEEEKKRPQLNIIWSPRLGSPIKWIGKYLCIFSNVDFVFVILLKASGLSETSSEETLTGYALWPDRSDESSMQINLWYCDAVSWWWRIVFYIKFLCCTGFGIGFFAGGINSVSIFFIESSVPWIIKLLDIDCKKSWNIWKNKLLF